MVEHEEPIGATILCTVYGNAAERIFNFERKGEPSTMQRELNGSFGM
jgi:hypothetical protein